MVARRARESRSSRSATAHGSFSTMYLLTAETRPHAVSSARENWNCSNCALKSVIVFCASVSIASSAGMRALAEKYEHQRDEWLARYHQYEFASAAFQIGIVVASSAVITGIVALAWLAGAAGIVGLGFLALGLLAPHALHLAGH